MYFFQRSATQLIFFEKYTILRVQPHKFFCFISKMQIFFQKKSKIQKFFLKKNPTKKKSVKSRLIRQF